MNDGQLTQYYAANLSGDKVPITIVYLSPWRYYWHRFTSR